MGKYILKRFLHLIWILLALSFLTFLLLYLAPGDAAEKKLNAQGIAVSQEVLDQTRRDMGLDRPFIAQYGNWLLGVLRLDLGTSYKDGVPVGEKLVKGLKNTLVLALGSLALSLIVALPLSLLTALRRDGLLAYILRFPGFLGTPLPGFLVSVLLMYLLCVRLKLLPVLADRSLKGLLLPCLALSIPMCSRFLRQFRAELLEQLGRPYVQGALTRGVKARYILLRNVLRNASISILTIVGLSVGTLMGGSVVIETIFRWPGLGKLAMEAITARDLPVIQGFVLLTSTIYVLVNLLTDLAYHLVDPRVREV